MRQRYRNQKERARRVEEAPLRQALYDALTPQQKFDRVVTRSFMDASRSLREVDRIVNGPGGEEVRT